MYFSDLHRVLHSFPTRRSSDLKRVTDEVTFLPAIDRAQVYSIRTPNVRYLEVINEGLRAGNIVPADFPAHPSAADLDRKSTRLNSSHQIISYAVFCLKKKKIK